MNMKLVCVLNAAALSLLLGSVEGNDVDQFNYGEQNQRIGNGGGTSYGQQSWDSVTCDNVGQCDGYPNYFEFGNGFSVAGDSNCRYCPVAADGSESCGLQRQSPIDLKRDRGVIGDPNEKDCPDWHWMAYRPDSCSWEDMATKDTFQIERHALQVNIPTDINGDIDCKRKSDGARRWPRLDYSKGFPDWWWMSRMDVTVPSQHHQEGKQYAAEVTLAHFYEVEHPKNQIGHVTLMMQDYPGVESWPYLDKLICAWRAKEEKVRSACNLPPAPPYGRCRLYRGQEATEDWMEEAGLREAETSEPTGSPTTAKPTSAPSASPTSAPSTKGPTSAPATQSPVTAPLTSTPTSSPNTGTPTTKGPTIAPTSAPFAEAKPTRAPFSFGSFPGIPSTPLVLPMTTTDPTAEPTIAPSEKPTGAPTDNPLVLPLTTTAPAAEPTIAPSEKPTSVPSAKPTTGKPTSVPTAKPVSLVRTTSQPISVAAIECNSFRVNYNRMCFSSDACCESTRADTSFCWDVYDNYFPGNDIYSACSSCCVDEENPDGKEIGPPNPPHPTGIEKTLQCSTVDNPYRMCKENSCCSGSDSGHCQELYDFWGDDMEQICWYCCREPQLLDMQSRQRNLRLGSNSTFEDQISAMEQSQDDVPPVDSKVVYLQGKKIILRPENFEEEEEDDDTYFERIHSEFKGRNLQSVVYEEDYEDVPYWPYEWLLKVDTEYYYRYEGTQVVPPCWEIVHWRVMKDPIRVHSRQIAELNRLLASRIDPESCGVDTAGVVAPDGKTVSVSREISYTHAQHRKVFCECKDWPSKFESDRNWCRNWKDDTEYKRFYEYPYNFETNGEF